MLDDGTHGDGLADDGVYGAEIPPFPHDSQVRYRIVAKAGDVETISPVRLDPADATCITGP
jgi:hypothetical protein